MQISVDATVPSEVHYQIGRELKSLREQGILLLGSGDIVYNLILSYGSDCASSYGVLLSGKGKKRRPPAQKRICGTIASPLTGCNAGSKRSGESESARENRR